MFLDVVSDPREGRPFPHFWICNDQSCYSTTRLPVQKQKTESRKLLAASSPCAWREIVCSSACSRTPTQITVPNPKPSTHSGTHLDNPPHRTLFEHPSLVHPQYLGQQIGTLFAAPLRWDTFLYEYLSKTKLPQHVVVLCMTNSRRLKMVTPGSLKVFPSPKAEILDAWLGASPTNPIVPLSR